MYVLRILLPGRSALPEPLRVRVSFENLPSTTVIISILTLIIAILTFTVNLIGLPFQKARAGQINRAADFRRNIHYRDAASPRHSAQLQHEP